MSEGNREEPARQFRRMVTEVHADLQALRRSLPYEPEDDPLVQLRRRLFVNETMLRLALVVADKVKLGEPEEAER